MLPGLASLESPVLPGMAPSTSHGHSFWHFHLWALTSPWCSCSPSNELRSPTGPRTQLSRYKGLQGWQKGHNRFIWEETMWAEGGARNLLVVWQAPCGRDGRLVLWVRRWQNQDPWREAKEEPMSAQEEKWLCNNQSCPERQLILPWGSEFLSTGGIQTEDKGRVCKGGRKLGTGLEGEELD